LTPKVTSISDRLAIRTFSPEETVEVAKALAAALPAGACVALYGDLGAGKTVFARGLIHGLGVPDEVPVTSPTFVIVSEYEGRVPIHHIDAYRLGGTADIVDLGSRELFFEKAVSIVEWAERIERALPEERVDVALTVAGETERNIEIRPRGRVYAEAVAAAGERLNEPRRHRDTEKTQ
jgi:tRNA threonylcarbamoyladenosine biosynthesis protein TsaE